MTIKEIREILELLCIEFNVPVIPIKLVSGQRAMFRFKYNNIIGVHDTRIHIGKHAWRGHETALIHEMAHYLESVNNGWQVKQSRHAVDFSLALAKVAMAYYGTAHKYDWEKDYKQVKSWYVSNKERLQ